MKSTDIKNWSYELSYAQMIDLEDFQELLTKAISERTCLKCGSLRATNYGLCSECLDRVDKETLKKVDDTYEVEIIVRKKKR